MHQERNSKQSSQQVRDGETVLRKIEQMREALYPQHTSGNRSKWEQYLPGPENSYQFASLSKEQHKLDHYRYSLERKLERLFKQEKDLLKQRHFVSSLGDSKNKSTYKANRGQIKADLITSNSVENMQRKIKQLQERYKGELERNKSKQIEKQSKGVNPILIAENTKPNNQLAQPANPFREKIMSEMVSNKQSRLKSSRQRSLSCQVDELRQAIQQLKQSNQFILQKMAHREQKKKYKKRSKEILVAILDKLEFINSQITYAKKKVTTSEPNTKANKQALELAKQFECLKQQYLKLDQEKKKVELKQQEIQKKFSRLTQKN